MLPEIVFVQSATCPVLKRWGVVREGGSGKCVRRWGVREGESGKGVRRWIVREDESGRCVKSSFQELI